MEVLGPRRAALTSGWCRPFESARLGVPQIGFRGVGGLGSEGWNGGTTAGRWASYDHCFGSAYRRWPFEQQNAY